MQTNIEITTTTIPQLMGYQDSFKNIESQQLRGEDAMIDGTSYQIVSSAHMLEMQNLLRRSLDKPEVTELETNVVLYENIYGRLPQTTGPIADQEQQGQQVHQVQQEQPEQ